MPPSKEQNDWVGRVLGVRTAAGPSPQEALKATVAALAEKAAKVAAAPRPAAAPKQQATDRLLSSMAERPAPEDPADTPAHVAEFLPAFLVSVETERPAASQKLEAGSPVPGPDQLLGIADLFAAAQRSLIEWENILDKAEAADRTVDVIEDDEENRDEQDYAASLATYNVRRHDGIAAEERATKLMTELQAKFNSLSESAQAAALQETHDA